MHHNSKKISLFATVLILLSLVVASAASMAPTIARAQEENSTNATSTNATSTNQTTGPTNNATNATTPTTTTPTTNATTNATTPTTTTNATKPVCTCNNTNQTAPPAIIVVPPAGNVTGGGGGGGNVTIPSTTPTNETHLKTMLLTAVPDRSTIDRGSTQRITITATDENGTGIPGANVTTLTLNYASGANKTLAAGSTDQNGQFVTTAKIGGNSKPGQFNIIASAKHDGYADAKAISGFVVNKKGK